MGGGHLLELVGGSEDLGDVDVAGPDLADAHAAVQQVLGGVGADLPDLDAAGDAAAAPVDLQVQSRVKMLEKLELIEVDEVDTSALKLKFPPSPRSGNFPVIMDGVGKSYDDRPIFSNASLTIERGDKVAFVGSER